MPAIRAFLALEVPEDVRARLAAWIDEARRLDWPGRVRWVPAANLHLTLRFLGRLEADDVAPFLRALEERFHEVPGFDWRLAEVILFPSRERPYVLALSVAPCESLDRLARLAEDAARTVGQEADRRRYHPHLTLGRMRRPRAARPADAASAWGRSLATARPIAGETCAAREAVLFQSELGPAGARYSPIGSVPIGRTQGG